MRPVRSAAEQGPAKTRRRKVLFMNKKISLGAAICFMAIAAAIAFTVTMAYARNIFN